MSPRQRHVVMLADGTCKVVTSHRETDGWVAYVEDDGSYGASPYCATAKDAVDAFLARCPAWKVTRVVPAQPSPTEPAPGPITYRVECTSGAVWEVQVAVVRPERFAAYAHDAATDAPCDPALRVPVYEAAAAGQARCGADPETAVARLAVALGWGIRAILPPGHATIAQCCADLAGFVVLARLDGLVRSLASAGAVAAAAAAAWREESAPTDAEIDAHHAAGGAWVLLLRDGAMTLERSSLGLIRHYRDKGMVRRWLALDAEISLARGGVPRAPA